VADPRKPSWRTVIKRMDPDYLYAEDLGGAGTKLDVEIVDSGKCRLKNPGGTKETLYIAFRDKKKKLGLNATMAKTLTSICGSDHWGDWRGWITLVVLHGKMRDPTTEQLEEMDFIRIAPARPQVSARGQGQQRTTAPAPNRGASGDLTDEERAEIARKEASES
jgi:hypothetical protein